VTVTAWYASRESEEEERHVTSAADQDDSCGLLAFVG
jgi:hypothetical protein